LAAQSYHRPARHRFALAPSRLLGNLGIRLMRPLARRTPKDQWRGPRAYNPDEPREFLMGRTTDSWRTAETWIGCLASHSVPLHATAGLSAHPDVAHFPTEPGIWDRYDRCWRSRSAIRQASCSRPRLDRASYPVASPRCGMASLAGLSTHRRPCTDCGHIPLPIVLIGVPFMVVACRPLRYPRRDNWTMAGRRLSPYRSRASPRRKLPALTNFARPSLSRVSAKRIHNSYNAIVLHVCPKHPLKKTNDPRYSSPACRRFCESAIADKVMRCYGAGG
jgi:hypothetical protein